MIWATGPAAAGGPGTAGGVGVGGAASGGGIGTPGTGVVAGGGTGAAGQRGNQRRWPREANVPLRADVNRAQILLRQLVKQSGQQIRFTVPQPERRGHPPPNRRANTPPPTLTSGPTVLFSTTSSKMISPS